MASVNGVSGSGSTSSLYGNRNIISGLASGMDTEAMIENSVSGFRAKITSLKQKQTVLQWKQDSYRSIIDKMYGFKQKYISFTSKTNLFSLGFFNKAVTVMTNGKYADKVSASGKTSSTVQINSVQQLAEAARYTVGSRRLTGGGSGVTGGAGGSPGVTGGELDLTAETRVSTLSGTMTLQYGNKSVDLDFGEIGEEVFTDAAALRDAIEKKLEGQYIITSSGSRVKASDLINVKLEDGAISFSDKSGGGNSVSISGVTGQMKETLGLDTSGKPDSFSVAGKDLSKTVAKGEYLSGKTLSVTLDGVTKKIKLPEYEKGENGDYKLPGDLPATTENYAKLINEQLAGLFGTYQDGADVKNKIAVDVAVSADGKEGLRFTVAKGSTLSLSSEAGTELGLGGTTATSYLSTAKTLGQMGILTDSMRIPSEDGEGYRMTADGKYLYDFKLNGVSVGQFTEDTALESVLTAINSNTEAGVSVSYSKITDQFTFTAKETGAAGKIDFGEGLAQAMFGSTRKLDTDGNPLEDGAGNPVMADTFHAGVDAVFSATINNQELTLTRASNVVDIDGLSVTLKGTFAAADDTEAVTFTSKSDADTIVDAISSFVKDYNEMVQEIHDAYSTLPAQKSKGVYYQPLTEEDKATMSESAIKAYEEKAKQGVLFADQNLSSLYNRLRSAVTPGGSDGAALRSIGINTAYSDGLTTLSLDEEALRDALESNPDRVRDLFTKTRENGAATDGLMQRLSTTLENYASTSAAGLGILVQRAGSSHAPTSLMENTWQKNLNDLDDQIDKWQEKLSDQVDYYTRRFSALEQLVAQMNSQSSSLMSMMGGY